MKRCLAVFVAMCLVWTTGTVSASLLVYQPESLSLTIPAGAEQQTFIKVGVEDGSSATYYLFFMDRLVNANLPAEWLSVSPASAFLFGSSSATSLLTIRVPDGTSTGVYSAYMLARARAPHDVAQSGNGLRIDVTVPSQCSGIPVVTVDSLQPLIIWPPDHSMTQVVVTGTVQMPAGCTIAEAGYSIEDEYRVLSGIGRIGIDTDGNFTVALPVEAMRHGQDKDGRHYAITVYARNEAGSGSSVTRTVVVPHDHSGK